jgi:hypothetical protein
MIKNLLCIAALAALIAQPVTAQVLLSTNGTTYTQDFNSLASAGTSIPWSDSSTLPGWYAARQSGGPVWVNYVVGTGTANSGAIYSFGTNGASPLANRALGSLASGTPGTVYFGVRFQNDSANMMTNVTVSFTGEQWRMGGNATVQTLAFSYIVSSSPVLVPDMTNTTLPWVPFTSLDFKSPWASATPSSGTAMDGHASTNRLLFVNVRLPDDAALQPGQELFLRWTDLNDAGNDHGMAIDDMTVNFTSIYVPPTPPTIVTPPVSTSADVWANAGFSVTASGTPPLTYRWYRNGTALTNNATYSGATTPNLAITKAVHANAGDYTVIVSNGLGSATNDPAATLTVNGFALTPLTNAYVLSGDTTLPQTCRIVDAGAAISAINATSSDQTLLPDANINLAVSGEGFTIIASPADGQSGVAVVTVTVTDANFFTATVKLPVEAVPSTSVFLNDNFMYGTSTPLVSGSGNFWNNHAGTLNDLGVLGNQAILIFNKTEDVDTRLIGAPYMTNSGVTLYSKFTVNFSALPNGNYFAHYMDTNTGAATGYGARVWASTNNTPVGQFRLGIGNGTASTATSGQYTATDLSLGNNYTVVTRFVLATGTATIWVDPTSESSPSATATDTSTNPPNAINVVAYALRQNSGMGTLALDDLVIGNSWGAIMGLPETPAVKINSIAQASGTVAIKFQSNVGGDFELWSATSAAGPYTGPVAGSLINGTGVGHYQATVPASGAVRFYRIKKL